MTRSPRRSDQRNAKKDRFSLSHRASALWQESASKEGLAEKALDSVKEHLDTKYGIMILQPAYTQYYLNLGEISSYPPGYKENAGIFCHNNPWVSIAETVIGRGNRAFEIYKKTCPSYIENISEIHCTEPYVYSQMVAGADAVLPRSGKEQLADWYSSMDFL